MTTEDSPSGDTAADDDEPSGPARLLPPVGTAPEPPLPSVIARLPVAAGGGASYVDTRQPSFVFLAVVAAVSLGADIATKAWAAKRLDAYPGAIQVWKDHIQFILAKNKGGAWGLLQSAHESVRRPFFLLVSIAAIAFIVTLYRKLDPRQTALKWGLPLVLGGALGNVLDRIRLGSVIDFIDCHVIYKGHDHHWPTFNVADIAICVGVGLMAVDMFTAKRVPGGYPPRGIPASPVDEAPSAASLGGAPAPDTTTPPVSPAGEKT